MLHRKEIYNGDYFEYSFLSARCCVSKELFEDVWYLGSLRSKEVGKKHASKLLDGVCEDADRNGWVVTLLACPSPDSSLNKRQLLSFYERKGFQIVDGDPEKVGMVSMKREPRRVECEHLLS